MSGRKIGTIVVVVLKAKNLPNKRHIGKQDPYCVLKLDDQTRRTKAVKRGGQHPEWDDELRFPLYETVEEELARTNVSGAGGSTGQSPPPPPPKDGANAKAKKPAKRVMQLSCYADDPREPDFIGETTVDLTESLSKGETDEWFTLMNKQKYCGEVYLEITYWSEEEPPPKQQPAQAAAYHPQYGGAGMFTPAGDLPASLRTGEISPLRNQNAGRPSASSISTAGRPSAASDAGLYGPRSDSLGIPDSLRPSSSLNVHIPNYHGPTSAHADFGGGSRYGRDSSYSSRLSIAPEGYDEFGAGGEWDRRRDSFPPPQNHHPRQSSLGSVAPSTYSQPFSAGGLASSFSSLSIGGPAGNGFVNPSSYPPTGPPGGYPHPPQSGFVPPPQPTPTPGPSAFQPYPSGPQQPYLPPSSSMGFHAPPPNSGFHPPQPTGYPPAPSATPAPYPPQTPYQQVPPPLPTATPAPYLPPSQPSYPNYGGATPTPYNQPSYLNQQQPFQQGPPPPPPNAYPPAQPLPQQYPPPPQQQYPPPPPQQGFNQAGLPPPPATNGYYPSSTPIPQPPPPLPSQSAPPQPPSQQQAYGNGYPPPPPSASAPPQQQQWLGTPGVQPQTLPSPPHGPLPTPPPPPPSLYNTSGHQSPSKPLPIPGGQSPSGSRPLPIPGQQQQQQYSPMPPPPLSAGADGGGGLQVMQQQQQQPIDPATGGLRRSNSFPPPLPAPGAVSGLPLPPPPPGTFHQLPPPPIQGYGGGFQQQQRTSPVPAPATLPFVPPPPPPPISHWR